MKLILCIFALVMGAMSDGSLEQILKAGNDRFTANMFQEVVKSEKDKSCVLSAFSVLSPLAQLALASVGESHDEIVKTIGFSNDTVTKDIIKGLNTKLRSIKGVDLRQANKVYIAENFSLNDQFAVISKDIFNSEVQNIDFGRNIEAAKEINKWVEDNTNHRIKDLVKADSIDGSTVAMLVNAIYFKGKWKEPFHKTSTSDEIFHVTNSKKVTVPMMHKTDQVQYAESASLDAKLIELPYEGDETSLIVALPNQIDGISELIQKLNDPATLNEALKSMTYNEVDISLPKFKIETTTDLKKVLQNMNVTKLFSPGDARLENLLNDSGNLYVSSATQKAFIEVSEEGTEAAAANVFVVNIEAAFPFIEPFEFKADHPFVFFLKQHDIILFNGVFIS